MDGGAGDTRTLAGDPGVPAVHLLPDEDEELPAEVLEDLAGLRRIGSPLVLLLPPLLSSELISSQSSSRLIINPRPDILTQL